MILEIYHFWCITLRDLFRSVLPTLNQFPIHHSTRRIDHCTIIKNEIHGVSEIACQNTKYSKNHHFQNRDFSIILCLVKCEQAHCGLLMTAWVVHSALYRMVYKPSSSSVSLKRYRLDTALGRKCLFSTRHRSSSASVSSKEHFENEIFWVSRLL